MCTDTDDLKALALACAPERCADEADEGRRLAEFHSECGPEVVLGLIAENERLRGLISPVANSTEKTRRRWLENIAAAIQVGLPKPLRQQLNRTYAEIQDSIQHGGVRRLAAEVEALRLDAERYRGVRRVANIQGFTDEQFDLQTDTRLAHFEQARAKEKAHG